LEYTAAVSALQAEPAHPGGRVVPEFRMLFILPRRVLALQEMKQLLPANFLARCLHEERASPSRADSCIDFPQQVLG